MACEYQESDVIFSDHPPDQGSASSYYILPPQPRKNSADSRRSNTNKKPKKLRGNNNISTITSDTVIPSLPICIPNTDHFRLRDELKDVERGWEGGGGEVVPPHLIVARRVAEFSVCSGRGRTLKGRDLKEVRDEILRMTGFLEA
uniref:Senescence regulator n=1 Tax=Kalanchoe fedtschenkoi TaxID=63787 RepID=A0A7N0T3V5_KALFE